MFARYGRALAGHFFGHQHSHRAARIGRYERIGVEVFVGQEEEGLNRASPFTDAAGLKRCHELEVLTFRLRRAYRFLYVV